MVFSHLNSKIAGQLLHPGYTGVHYIMPMYEGLYVGILKEMVGRMTCITQLGQSWLMLDSERLESRRKPLNVSGGLG